MGFLGVVGKTGECGRGGRGKGDDWLMLLGIIMV